MAGVIKNDVMRRKMYRHLPASVNKWVMESVTKSQ